MGPKILHKKNKHFRGLWHCKKCGWVDVLNDIPACCPQCGAALDRTGGKAEWSMNRIGFFTWKVDQSTVKVEWSDTDES